MIEKIKEMDSTIINLQGKLVEFETLTTGNTLEITGAIKNQDAQAQSNSANQTDTRSKLDELQAAAREFGMQRSEKFTDVNNRVQIAEGTLRDSEAWKTQATSEIKQMMATHAGVVITLGELKNAPEGKTRDGKDKRSLLESKAIANLKTLGNDRTLYREWNDKFKNAM